VSPETKCLEVRQLEGGRVALVWALAVPRRDIVASSHGLSCEYGCRDQRGHTAAHAYLRRMFEF